MKKLITFLLTAHCLVLVALALASQSTIAQPDEKITGRLLDLINRSSDTDFLPVIIVLQDQFPVADLDQQLYRQKSSLYERAYRVITELKQHASLTQPDLLNYLNSLDHAAFRDIQTFWITNAVALEARPAVIDDISGLPCVGYIDIDEHVELIEPREIKPAMMPNGDAEMGLKVVNAYQMWAAGYTGQGVILSNLDTGVDGTHPALTANWRGNQVPWQQAWFDAFQGTSAPTDQHGSQPQAGHGTGTMGTMVGLDALTNDTIGMAFGAEWIAARARFGLGGTTTSQILLCLEWIIDPDGDPLTSSDMPTVFNNSWGGSDNYQCTTVYDNALDAIEASGIAVVWAAGNDGPNPGTVIKPQNQNHTEMYAFSVGGIDPVDPDLIIDPMSSRGPTPCNLGTGNQIKPEITAPIYCRTAYTNHEYVSFYGTSMAAPHVSGAIALLKEAYPDRTGNELKWMLYGSAVDKGDPGEDNDYGMGVLDVWAAYLYHPDQDDPRRPLNVSTYSDYTTPYSVNLTWINPAQLLNGSLLDSFGIQIIRDDAIIATISSGIEFFEDTGLVDGQQYEYQVIAKDLTTDSLSMPVVVNVYAGGSPYPAPPDSLTCNYTGSYVKLLWKDPTTQSDGTPLDDLARIYIYRDEVLIDSVNPGTESYNDFPSTGKTVYYHLCSIDDETPVHISQPGEKAACFVGHYPMILVWVGPDTKFESRYSADTVYEILTELNIPVFLSEDLFAFGTELDSLEAIFAVTGCFPWIHILQQTGPEALPLETYLFNGGKVYFEGGHAFSSMAAWWPDPYDIHPWFGLTSSNMGSGDVQGILGQGYLSDFQFSYIGQNEFMNEMFPGSSTIIWKNSQNDDVCGVFYEGFGTGVSIGVIPSFGGLVQAGSYNKKDLMCRYLDLLGIEYDTTGVGLEEPAFLVQSSEFKVQSYPNPTRGIFDLRFTIYDLQSVTLKIYDIHGRQVANVLDEMLPAGEHVVRWDMSGLPAGVYVVELRAEGDGRRAVSKLLVH
jgi:subtilisin family serine protease